MPRAGCERPRKAIGVDHRRRHPGKPGSASRQPLPASDCCRPRDSRDGSTRAAERLTAVNGHILTGHPARPRPHPIAVAVAHKVSLVSRPVPSAFPRRRLCLQPGLLSPRPLGNPAFSSLRPLPSRPQPVPPQPTLSPPSLIRRSFHPKASSPPLHALTIPVQYTSQHAAPPRPPRPFPLLLGLRSHRRRMEETFDIPVSPIFPATFKLLRTRP